MSVVVLAGTATLPLTYPDIRCLDDVDLLARETTSDLETLEQDVLHVLVETLGSNLDDPLRGLGLPQLLSGTTVPLQSLGAVVVSQLTKDDRIDSATCNITQTGDSAFRIEIVISVATAVLGLYYAATAAGGLLPV